MVVSKKCKICTALNDDNIALYGEYFDKSLPTLIEKLSGLNLDPRKANGVLICKLCAIQLAQADVFIDKLRNALQRLTKLVKETKPRASLKEGANSSFDESKLKTVKTPVRRKSVFIDVSFTKKETEESKEANGNLTKVSELESPKPDISNEFLGSKSSSINEENQNGEMDKKVSIKEITKVKGKENSKINVSSNEPCVKVGQKPKTPAKVVKRRKSVIPIESATDNGSLQKNCDHTTKFKKILDDEETAVKSTPAKALKRKQLNDGGNNNLNKSDIDGPTPTKRNNSLSFSTSEGALLNISKDDQDFTRSNNKNSVDESNMKMMNCVICGKEFNKKASLREHIESSHMGEKLKQCPHCSMEFRSQQKYESHVFSQKCLNAKHACQYPKCNRRFKTPHKMDLHMQEKHSTSQQESDVE